MKTYRVKYHAPWHFANFACAAPSLEAGRAMRKQRDEHECWEIANREIKSETFR
jgi:hypothetical protein